MTWTHTLLETDWPDTGPAEPLPWADATELQPRLARARALGYSHLLVYGDREHYANLLWATGFDPRFEEALLLLPAEGTPLLLVGNECIGYLRISALYTAGLLRGEVYPPFSLMDQPRNHGRTLREIFTAEGLAHSPKLGVVGWKDYDEPTQSDLPSYLIDLLRQFAPVENATRAFTRLRAQASPWEIAYFEGANVAAAEAMRRMLFGLREGLTDHQVATQGGYNGRPMACHWTVKTGPTRVSLASASGNELRRGEYFSANVSYWGSNCCRCGWLGFDANDAPAGYVDEFAGPYVAAMAAWFEHLTVGRSGGELFDLIQRLLPFEQFGIFLNPGHLIHFDEWPGSPIYAGSTEPLTSGMILQSDIIPSSSRFSSVRMEDSYALADEALRAAVAAQYPGVWNRIEQRREFMTEALGFVLPPEVLPLGDLCGLVPPYLFEPNVLIGVRR